MNINTFHHMSYGVYIVTALDGERPTGCVANSIMQITATPSTVAVSMNHDNYTHQCISKTGYFAVSILSEQTNPKLIGTFGFRSGKDMDKFAGVDYQMVEGLPVISDACGYLVCRVIDTMDTPTHTVFLGEVVECDVLEDAPAMTYAYYHQVIKGKSPKNAPTYIEKKPAPVKTKYVCEICGYEHVADSLPEDFRCPVCGVDASLFKKAE